MEFKFSTLSRGTLDLECQSVIEHKLHPHGASGTSSPLQLGLLSGEWDSSKP